MANMSFLFCCCASFIFALYIERVDKITPKVNFKTDQFEIIKKIEWLFTEVASTRLLRQIVTPADTVLI